MKIVVYTCITGEYDALKPIKNQQQSTLKTVDFICFTDNLAMASFFPWQKRPIPNDLLRLDQIRQQRILKICPHRYLKEYDVSIWIDGSFEIIKDICDFISQYDMQKCPLYVRVHSCRNCIYEEAKACLKFGKDSKETIDKQIDKYRHEGYPAKIGMVETGIILRRHNDPMCQQICNFWATELLMNSYRDQLSFNYVCWKHHFLPGCLNKEFDISRNRSNTFKIHPHGR